LFGGEARAVQIGQLVGMQLHAQAAPSRRQIRARLFRRKRDAFAEGVNRIHEPSRTSAGIMSQT